MSDSGRWSWGESNPRPALSLWGFSGRSLCRRSTRLRPLSQTPKSTSPVEEKSRTASRHHRAARPLDDARIRVGITHGLTDYRARLRSEGEVSALGFGTYWFAGSVYEITLHPRPASRRFTSTVETDQPRESFVRREPLSLCGVVTSGLPEHYRLQQDRPRCHSRLPSPRTEKTNRRADLGTPPLPPSSRPRCPRLEIVFEELLWRS
jgi:hypothetical protein